jgi:hypothetical protein
MLADDFKPGNSVKDLLKALFFPVVILWTVISHIMDKHFFDRRFEKRSSKKLRDQFAREIEEAVPYLFADFGAQIIPNTEEYPPAFDYAAVTVSVSGMLLLFSRCRGDFKVEATPPEKPTPWRELSSVVRNSDVPGSPNRKVDCYGLNDFGRFFRANLDIIRHEVSKPDWRPAARWLVPI